MHRQYTVKMIGNVSDLLSYAGALIKVADSAGSTVKDKFGSTIWVLLWSIKELSRFPFLPLLH